jgi:hypothetical protein
LKELEIAMPGNPFGARAAEHENYRTGVVEPQWIGLRWEVELREKNMVSDMRLVVSLIKGCPFERGPR